jgi:hypothetical protein
MGDTLGLNAPIGGCCALGTILFAFASRVFTAFAWESLSDGGVVILGCGIEMAGGSGTGFNDSFGGDFGGDCTGGCVIEAWLFCRGTICGTKNWG